MRGLEGVGARLRAAAGESVLLNRFFRGETEQESARPGRTRFRVMQGQETSRVRGWMNRIWERMLAAAVGSLALTVFLAAAVTLILLFTNGNGRMGIPAAVALLSVLPGLGERRSLSHCLLEGRLTGPFLTGFCGLSPDRLGEGGAGVGVVHRFLPLFCGITAGIVGAFLPPPVLPLAIPVAAVWFLFRAVPELSVLALLLAFPFLPLLPHPTLMLTAGAALSLAVFAGKWLSGRRDFHWQPVDRCVATFCAVYLLAGGGTGAGMALLTAGGWFTVRNLGARWRARAAGCLILSVSVTAGIGLAEYATGRAALRWVDLTCFSDIGGRVCATFDNPNILAVCLLAVYPLALGGAGLFKRTAARIASGIGAGCIAACTVLTWSRGAWLGILLETLVFLLLFSRRTLAVLAVLPLPVAAVLPYLPHSLTNRFTSIGNLAESSVRYRLEVWQGVFRMLAANPFGIGPREADFRRIWQRFALPGTETVMHAHALFPQTALETGLAGAAVFAVLLVCLARTFRPGGLPVSGLSALCGLLVMGLFDHLWYARGMVWLTFAVAALIPAAREEETRNAAMELD